VQAIAGETPEPTGGDSPMSSLGKGKSLPPLNPILSLSAPPSRANEALRKSADGRACVRALPDGHVAALLDG
jgi:hypothetical protein